MYKLNLNIGAFKSLIKFNLIIIDVGKITGGN